MRFEQQKKSDRYEYSKQVHYINRNLGMKYRFVNIFISSQRIKSSSHSDEVDESFQNSRFIDVDKLSLIGLLQPYLHFRVTGKCLSKGCKR